MRREPEGIEHEVTPKSSRPSSALQGGLYDHSQEYDHKKSQEYDPYQSAARQMQDLLFGTSSGKKTTFEIGFVKICSFFPCSLAVVHRGRQQKSGTTE